MKSALIITVVLAFAFTVSPVAGDLGADLLVELQGLACQEGFNMIPEAITSSIVKCGAQAFNIVSYACFKACVFKEMNMDNSVNGTASVDLGAMDMHVMSAFKMDMVEGRRSYTKIAGNAHDCAKSYLNSRRHSFPMGYTDTAACDTADIFYKCCLSVLECPNAMRR